jgi:antibiotic biosynthesis monooxygenase (ABM) superfamily enzyme
VIRVIYRWRVEVDRHAEFVQWWHAGTLRIRTEYPGAMGSTLCRRTPVTEGVVAIARWRSQEDLERFWQSPGGSQFPGAEMESIEILNELDHLTQED